MIDGFLRGNENAPEICEHKFPWYINLAADVVHQDALVLIRINFLPFLEKQSMYGVSVLIEVYMGLILCRTFFYHCPYAINRFIKLRIITLSKDSQKTTLSSFEYLKRFPVMCPLI